MVIKKRQASQVDVDVDDNYNYKEIDDEVITYVHC